MALDVTTPHAFSIRAVPTQSVPVNTTPQAVILVPVPGGPGPAGQPGGTVQRVTAAALSGHRVVTPLNDGTVDYADATNTAHAARPMWLTTSAWLQGATATLTAAGPVAEPTWSWTPGQPIYLGANGALTQTPIPGAAFVLIVAEVIDATTIEFRPQVPIITA
jgi:hypothetical protein